MRTGLPVGAIEDPALQTQLREWCADLPSNLRRITSALRRVSAYAEYDPAIALVRQLVDPQLPALLRATSRTRMALPYFVSQFMPDRMGFVLARLVHDRSPDVRRAASHWVRGRSPEELEAWDAARWLADLEHQSIKRHRGDPAKQARLGLPKLETVGELRALLGVKSEAQLGFLLVASDEGDNAPYRCFEMPKRSGGTRRIAAPCKQLKFAQRALLEKLLYRRPVHDAAHGFVPGRSTVTHAAKHQGRKLVIGFDLEDFFPTIHYARVTGLFGAMGYHVGEARFSNRDDSRNVAATLARLCCYAEDPTEWGEGALPQGAPTSPAISNLICRRMDARLHGLAQRLGGSYSRYADDLAFSFDGLEDRRIGRLRWWVAQICGQEGFRLNQAKFRVVRHSQRQKVTGIVVNDCLRVPRADRRRFRAILHNCQKHGIESQRRGRDDFEGWLKGFAAYINMVHPEEGRPLLAAVDALLEGK